MAINIHLKKKIPKCIFIKVLSQNKIEYIARSFCVLCF